MKLLALPFKKIKSLRELNGSHLALLKNIRDAGTAAISKKFNIPASQLRIYFHYQPSYYYLHVHFCYLMFDAPGKFVQNIIKITDKKKMSFMNNLRISISNYKISFLSFLGIYVEKAHLLSTVIKNIELMSDYYTKAVLSYVVFKGSPLYEKFKSHGTLQTSVCET